MREQREGPRVCITASSVDTATATVGCVNKSECLPDWREKGGFEVGIGGIGREWAHLHPEIKYKKPHFQDKLYQECGFLFFISGCRVQLESESSKRAGHVWS
eukprot:3411378-Rhodomonas_salina.2